LKANQSWVAASQRFRGSEKRLGTRISAKKRFGRKQTEISSRDFPECVIIENISRPSLSANRPQNGWRYCYRFHVAGSTTKVAARGFFG